MIDGLRRFGLTPIEIEWKKYEFSERNVSLEFDFLDYGKGWFAIGHKCYYAEFPIDDSTFNQSLEIRIEMLGWVITLMDFLGFSNEILLFMDEGNEWIYDGVCNGFSFCDILSSINERQELNIIDWKDDLKEVSRLSVDSFLNGLGEKFKEPE